MTELDNAVRDSLRTRALDITTVPADLLDWDTPGDAERGPRRHWLAVAAAALVLIAAGAVFAVVHRGRPSPVPPGSCRTQLPRTWQQALTITPDERGVQVLAGLNKGTLLQLGGGELATRLRDGTLQNFVVDKSSVAPQLSEDGRDITMLLHNTGGAGNEDTILMLGVHSGSYGMRQHFRPDYYQRVTRAYVQDGRVYFTSNYGGGSIRMLDLRKGPTWMHTSTLYVGKAFGTLTAHPGVDVSWQGRRIAKQLPAPLQAALRGVDPAKVAFSDGAYTWSTSRGIYRYFGGAVEGPYLAGGDGWQPLGTAGRYLVVRHNAGTIQLYDTTSRTLADTGLFGTVVTSGDVLAVNDANGAHILDTTTVPELRC
jgi:hypothetical protein